MKKRIIFIFLILFLSCGIFDTKEDQIIQKLYVCIQGENKVAVYNTPSLSLLKLIDVDFSAGVNIPHFVILDEINNYWFVTAMNGGYVARFDLLTDEFIDIITVGTGPALMTIDPANNTLFCSRMVMMGGSSGSNIITEINYTETEMSLGDHEFTLDSYQLHGITYDYNKNNIIVTSILHDWLYKIPLDGGAVTSLSMHPSAGYLENNPANLLQPIRTIVLNDNLIAISCSAPPDGINGQVQMWNISTNPMSKVATYEFNSASMPWHLIKSPNSNDIFVVLRGDSGEGGVVRLGYNEEGFNNKPEWQYNNIIFNTFHGITIDESGEYIYVTSAGENKLYQFSALNGALIDETPLGMNPGGLSLMQNICIGCE